MSGMELARTLVATLPTQAPGLFNPYTESCEGDTALNNPEARLARLGAYLATTPKLLLLGEAAGYLGARRSALTFTSERLLLDGAIPRVAAPVGRLTQRHLPYSEPSATIVWKTLYRLGLEQAAVMWNALPLHPFKPGNPDSNRTPTEAEVALGESAMRLLLSAFPGAVAVAVGKKAERLLQKLGVEVFGTVRHPANGGARQFYEGLAALAYRV